MISKKATKDWSPIIRWSYVLLGIIIMMFLGTVYSYSVFRLSIEDHFNIGATQSGMPYMMALAFYALFMLITGRYLERFHPRTIILFGGALVVIGWILSSLATNVWMLTITYGGISGAGVGIAYGAPMTVVAKWFPEKKGLSVGMVLLGFGLSPLIMAPIARTLIEQQGLMKTFFILGITLVIALPILSYPFRYPTETELKKRVSYNSTSEETDELTTKDMLQTKSFYGLYFTFLIGTMIGLMLIGMTTSIGMEFIGLKAKTVTGIISIFAIFNGIGRPIFGWLTDRLGTKKSMLLSYFLIAAAAFLLLVFGKDSMIIYIVAFSIFWFNLGGWLAIAPASTLRLYGIKHYSQNYGVIFTAYGLGAIAGVTSSGLMLDRNGNYQDIFYYILALCCIGIVLTLTLIKNHRLKM